MLNISSKTKSHILVLIFWPSCPTLVAQYCDLAHINYVGCFDLHASLPVGPNPGFGSSLSQNISPNTTKFFTHVLYVF